MMKRIILAASLTVGIMCLSFGAGATVQQYLEAPKAEHIVTVNNIETNTVLPMVSIDDRTYIQVRALGEILSVGVEWNEETETINLITDQVGLKFTGMEPWNRISLGIEKETAAEIADAVFLQWFGEEFVRETTRIIEESEDGQFYSVLRWKPPMLGGYSLSIRKSDGKIVDMILQE